MSGSREIILPGSFFDPTRRPQHTPCISSGNGSIGWHILVRMGKALGEAAVLPNRVNSRAFFPTRLFSREKLCSIGVEAETICLATQATICLYGAQMAFEIDEGSSKARRKQASGDLATPCLPSRVSRNFITSSTSSLSL
jgi:hypothetical protein